MLNQQQQQMNVITNTQQQMNQFMVHQEQRNDDIIDIVQELITEISNEIK
jgi:hypothetical protein